MKLHCFFRFHCSDMIMGLINECSYEPINPWGGTFLPSFGFLLSATSGYLPLDSSSLSASLFTAVDNLSSFSLLYPISILTSFISLAIRNFIRMSPP